MDVKHWYLLNGLQLNADKSEVMLVGIAYQLRAASVKSVSVADSSLSIIDKMKTLGVVLDCRLTFDNHVSPVITTMRKRFVTYGTCSIEAWRNS